MEGLIKKILKENVEEKLYNITLKDLKIKGLSFEFETSSFDTGGEMYDEYTELFDDYINDNWENYFTNVSLDDDDEPSSFTKIDDPLDSNDFSRRGEIAGCTQIPLRICPAALHPMDKVVGDGYPLHGLHQ